MNDLAFLEETLVLAGNELATRFGQDNNARQKADTSIVTDADLAAEKIVLDRIRKYYPKDAIIAEESGYIGVERKEGQHVWIIDPLDGTSNFANNYPFFCVSIGKCRFRGDGSIEVIAGGIRDPLRNHNYLATLGGGATVDGRPMRVKPDRELSQSLLVTGFYYSRGKDLSNEIDRFHRVAQICSAIRRDGSAALDLAMTAAGVFDAFWERGLAPWDVAAGSLLVQEAGGQVINYKKVDTEKSKAISTPFAAPASKLFYNLDGDGIIAGSKAAVSEISSIIR
jgi:myo-inositol-1(or 4)-monophosphatase